MPRIPMGRAGLAVVQGAPMPRVGPTPTTGQGMHDVAGALAGIAEDRQHAQNERDRIDEQKAAADAVGQQQARNEAERQRMAQSIADAKLAATNGLVEWELQADGIKRAADDDLAAGRLSPDQYSGRLAGDIRKMQQGLAERMPEMARGDFEAGIVKPAAKFELSMRDTLTKHHDGMRLAELDRGAENLARLAVQDLPRALKAGEALFSNTGLYAQIKGPEAAAKAGQRFQEQAGRAHYQARIAGAQNSAQALAGLRAEVAKAAALDPMQQTAMLSSIDSRMGVLENRAIAARERADKRAAKAVTDLERLTEGGFPVSAEFAGEVAAAVKGTDQAERARQLLSGAAAVSRFASRPVPEQQAVVAQLTRQAAEQGLDPDQADQLRRLQAARDRSANDYRENPWQAAADRGLLDAVPALDVSSLDGALSGLNERVALLPGLEQAAGGPVSPLQPEEAQGLAAMLGALDAPERARTLAMISNTVGEGRMMALAGQMAKGDPTMAVVAAAEAQSLRMESGESVGALILQGEQAIKGKQVKVEDLPGEGIQFQMREALGDAITNPQARNAAVDAAVKVWAAKAVTGDSIDYEDALQAVTGRIVEWGGGKTLAPVGWSEDEFERAIEGLDAAAIEQQAGGLLFVGGRSITAEQLAGQMEDVRLRQASGNGRYAVQVGSQLVTDESGRPAYLTLQKPGPAPSLWQRLTGD